MPTTWPGIMCVYDEGKEYRIPTLPELLCRNANISKKLSNGNPLFARMQLVQMFNI